MKPEENHPLKRNGIGMENRRGVAVEWRPSDREAREKGATKNMLKWERKREKKTDTANQVIEENIHLEGDILPLGRIGRFHNRNC
jgi:hypothetical protein